MTDPLTALLRLIVSDLACQRGDKLLFRGLSFSLGYGEAMVVTGANGVGKTSLIRALAGLIEPETGTIELQSPQADAPLCEQLHYLGHRDGLRAALTALENLTFAAQLLGGSGHAQLQALTQLQALAPLKVLAPLEALERVGLPRVADLPVSVLSAGQRRRVALARLLAVKRPIWLLDEPTSGLDAASQQMVADVIHDHIKSGGIAIAATHLSLGITSVSELRLAADGSHALVRGHA